MVEEVELPLLGVLQLSRLHEKESPLQEIEVQHHHQLVAAQMKRYRVELQFSRVC
jgi:hypothetical protein